MAQDKPSDQDLWTDRWLAAVYQFSLGISELDRTNPWPDQPLLPKAMNTLMTELWDVGFSQAQIRDAFEEAVLDMPRYTAGRETPSSP